MARVSLRRRLWLFSVANAFWLYYALYHRIRYEGTEHIPKRGPLMVTINHISVLEVFAMGVGLYHNGLVPGEDVFTVSKKELFEKKTQGKLARSLGMFPIDRAGIDLAAMRAIVNVLKDGKILALAPEGTRSQTGKLQLFEPVVAKIAVTRRVPILPVGAIGTFEALPIGTKIPRPVPITIRFGPVFELSEFYDTPLTDENMVRAAAVMREHVAALLPEWMREIPPDSTAREHTVLVGADKSTKGTR